MDRYVPIFQKVVDSSLWEEALHVRIVFLTLLAIKDPDHVARIQDHQIRRRANLESDDLVLDALRVLSSPDTRSKIEQAFDGRRIERVQDGWLLLNGPKYQEMMERLNRRAADAKRQRAKRERDRLREIQRDMAPLTKPAKDPVPGPDNIY